MDWRDNLRRVLETDPTKQMGFYCDICKQTFACEARDFDNTCLLCGAHANLKANNLPRKRKTHRQIREAVRARKKREAPPPAGHVYGSCTIKI